jgi:hypothetical protein
MSKRPNVVAGFTSGEQRSAQNKPKAEKISESTQVLVLNTKHQKQQLPFPCCSHNNILPNLLFKSKLATALGPGGTRTPL